MKKSFGLVLCLLLVLSPVVMASSVADIVIIGGGPAGLAAAVEAAVAGEKVILLEKMPVLGGALLYTGGTVSGAGTRIQAAQGIEDSPELHFLDSIVEGDFKVDPELLMLYCNLAGPTIEWLIDELGVEITEAVFAPEHTLYSVPRTYKPAMINGKAAVLHGLLNRIEELDNLEVRLNTEAIKLIQDELSGRVIGAMAVDEDGKLVQFYGQKGVILSTGGFGNNPALLQKYAKGAENWFMISAPGATGDGHRMAREVGATLVNMEYIPTYNYGFERANGQASMVYVRSELFGGVYINETGKRFVNELASQKEREKALREQPNSIMFEVFDEKIRLANNRPNINAFCESGEIVSAQTLEELALKLGLEPVTFAETIKTYNTYVENGVDKDFGKQPLTTKLESPPFYAAKLRPLGLLTLGGVKIDVDTRVLNDEGTPIPGLYAAGELLGAIHGTHISSGNGITAPLAFGRLAAQKVGENDTFFISGAISESMDLVLADGTFTGKATGFNGDIEVEVVVKSGEIANITVLSHNDTPQIAEGALKTMVARVTEANDINVDTVTGATYTSKGFLNAIKDAFAQ
ncbi:MAG: flavocytochrome c [Firmicutes bacterium]|nr:flavocytochrome c [Bacillota bacterium]